MKRRDLALYLGLPLAAALVAALLVAIVVGHVSAAGPTRTSVATFYSWQEYGCGEYKTWRISCSRQGHFACGGLYLRKTVGVAHKTLPCGTLVEFTYRGRTLVVPVVDRGPFSAGMDWDFTSEACLRLRHCFTGPIAWRIVQ